MLTLPEAIEILDRSDSTIDERLSACCVMLCFKSDETDTVTVKLQTIMDALSVIIQAIQEQKQILISGPIEASVEMKTRER